VIAYAVSPRTRETGIRVALGAQTSELRRMFVRERLLLAGIGSALGMLAGGFYLPPTSRTGLAAANVHPGD
jgi:ABC-type antimicrobial peptide transport system permease subunit